jgi:hypothetical protein
MRVGPSVWGPPSCEGLLCDCCVGVVNLTFSFQNHCMFLGFLLFYFFFYSFAILLGMGVYLVNDCGMKFLFE